MCSENDPFKSPEDTLACLYYLINHLTKDIATQRGFIDLKGFYCICKKKKVWLILQLVFIATVSLCELDQAL